MNITDRNIRTMYNIIYIFAHKYYTYFQITYDWKMQNIIMKYKFYIYIIYIYIYIYILYIYYIYN